MTVKFAANFIFSENNSRVAKKIIAKYPKGKEASALLPLLDLAQRQNEGWISNAVITYLSEMLHIQPIRIYEVVSFYTMFNLKPVGKHHVQLCKTTPCWLRGSDEISKKCKKLLNINPGETTADGRFSFTEVECLGACIVAPVVQINDKYYENLTPESFEEIINKLAKE